MDQVRKFEVTFTNFHSVYSLCNLWIIALYYFVRRSLLKRKQNVCGTGNVLCPRVVQSCRKEREKFKQNAARWGSFWEYRNIVNTSRIFVLKFWVLIVTTVLRRVKKRNDSETRLHRLLKFDTRQITFCYSPLLCGSSDHQTVVRRYQNELQADAVISLVSFVSSQSRWQVLPIITCDMNKPRWPVLQQALSVQSCMM